MKIDIKIDPALAVKGLTDFAQDQVPFAMSRALTETAKDVQAAVKADLPRKYTLRNRWVEGGIRIAPATKRAWEAQVGSRDVDARAERAAARQLGQQLGTRCVDLILLRAGRQREQDRDEEAAGHTQSRGLRKSVASRCSAEPGSGFQS